MISFYGFHSGRCFYSVKASIAILIPNLKAYSNIAASAKLHILDPTIVELFKCFFLFLCEAFFQILVVP